MGSLRRLAKLTTVALLSAVVLVLAPVARANMLFGNYNLQIVGRYDFHTWIWSITKCSDGCVHVNAIAQPVAKAFNYVGDAQLANGRYTLTVDVPDGLRCDNIYYGPTIPTHDIYTWDAATLAGSLESSFDAGCDGAPGGTHTHPFTLSRL
jgi:hypothetical protein